MSIDPVSKCLNQHSLIRQLLAFHPDQETIVKKVIAIAKVNPEHAQTLIDLHANEWRPVMYNEAKKKAIFMIYMQKAFKDCLS